APLREPAQARPARALVRGAARPRRGRLRAVRARPGGRRRRPVGSGGRGGGRRRRPAADDPRREGPRVQGRRRGGRGPRQGAAGVPRDPCSLRRSLRLPRRRPDHEQAARRVCLRRRPGSAKGGGPCRTTAPLLRRNDARDRPADHLGLDRSRPDGRRHYAERVVGMRPTDERRAVPGTPGLAATEIGDAVHRLLELVSLEQPLPPDDLVARVRAWYPRVNDDELERIGGFVRSYCESELARRVATLPGAQPERPFAFEHDGVLLHGRLDVLQLEAERAVVVDYKTNSLAEGTPEEIVEHDYRLQRLVYALACFRAGAQEV